LCLSSFFAFESIEVACLFSCISNWQDSSIWKGFFKHKKNIVLRE